MTESFAQLFEQSLANQRIRPGMILTGLVVDVTPDVVIVNVGLKSEAVIPLEQFKNERGEVEVKPGDQVEVALDSVEDGTGETRLSREKAKRARTWTRLEEAFNKSEIVTGVITGRVKGGFTVEIENVRAFLPGSLVDVRPVRDTSYLEGKPLEFKVIKLDQKRNNVVVSRRAVVEQEFSAERSALMDNLQEGAVVRGTVKNLTDYGAFVDLGGIDEGAVIGEVLDRAAHHRAFLQVVHERAALGGELLLDHRAARHHDVIALLIELDDLELERLAFEIRGIAHRAHVDERPWQERAHVLDLDCEAPLDAPGDDAGHDLGFVERLLEACPGAGALCLLARQAGLAGAVLDRIECDLHLVAGLDLDLAALVLELLEGDDGLGLEAYVDDDDVGGDIHHEPREDHSRADALIGETLLEKLRETFCHTFTLHASGVPSLEHSS